MDNNVIEADCRRARRATHLGRVFFVADMGFGKRGLGFLEDISMTGCRMVTESPLEIGMELGLLLVASSHESDVEIELAKVRRVNGTCSGLEFLAVDPIERERLRQFLKTM